MANQKRDIKVLVSADINGWFEQVISKVRQIHSKNQFNLMLLLGNVCHPRASPYIASMVTGQNSMPLTSYFIDSSKFAPVLQNLHPKGKEIVPNLRYLGKQGLAHLQGLNVAFFNNYDEKRSASQFQADVQSFLQTCRNRDIDILLTNQWPEQIKIISEKASPKTAEYVSRVANELCPRYHFASGCETFYRFPPYRNAKGRLTHFISVAPCQEELRDKYLFAVTIKTNHYEVPAENEPNCLQNPYLKVPLKVAESQGLSIQQRLANQAQKKKETISGIVVVFFEGFPEWARKEDISQFLERWGEIQHIQVFRDKKGGHSGTVRFSDQSSTKQCLGDTGKYMFHSSRIKFQARSLQDRQRVEDCWFCKANTDKSLIVWQGRYVYLCLEKGPLCRFHFQIIPYNHTQSSTRLDPHEQEEMSKVRERLTAHFTDEGFQVVSYQRCLPLSEAVNHCVVHLLPIKFGQSLARKFQQTNKDDGLGFKLWAGDKRSHQYFLSLQIDSKTYMKQVQRKQKVQADFMRQLLCELLQTPKLVNWKVCERKPSDLIAQLQESINQLRKAGLTS